MKDDDPMPVTSRHRIPASIRPRVERATAIIGSAAAVAVLLASCTSDAKVTTTAPPPAPPAASNTTTPHSSGSLATPVTLTSPVDGSNVQRCAVFTGTSHLQHDETIVLGMKNLNNGDREHYYELIHDWEYAAQKSTWKGYQWFGSDVNLSRQKYRVDVLIVTTDVVTTALALSKKKNTSWHPKTPDWWLPFSLRA
jgi:hypothetical protein